MAAVQRKELKRPDAFVTTGRRWIEWAVANQRTLAMAGAGALALILVIAGVSRYRVVQERQANEDLAAALSLYQDEQWSQAGLRLSEVAERWSGRGVSLVASFYAAQANLEAGDSAGARTTFESLSTRNDVPAYLRQQALLGLGFIATEASDDAAAAGHYAAAAALAGPYTGVALLGEARARIALGENEQAKALFERFLAEFPTSAERAAVEAQLAGL